MSVTRRAFLGLLAAVALAPAACLAQGFDLAPGERSLALRRGDQLVEVAYLRDGQLDLDAYSKLCWLLRDVQAGKQTQIDPQLLDILYAVQEHARGNGYSEPLQILSGYRTPATNRRSSGAQHSFHLLGRAADFRLPGLSAKHLGQVVNHLAMGGAGVYPGSDFLHVDTGWERSWKA